MSEGVCANCPHAVLDHDATGCISCGCGTVYTAADPAPEPAPEPEPAVETPETTEPEDADESA